MSTMMVLVVAVDDDVSQFFSFDLKNMFLFFNEDDVDSVDDDDDDAASAAADDADDDDDENLHVSW